MVTLDWTTLKSICLRFKTHSKTQYSDAAKVMNSTYSNEYTGKDFKSLFTDALMTTLKPDTLTLLKDLVKQSIIADTDAKEPSHRVIFVPKLVDTAPFSYPRVVCRFRNLAHFAKLLDYFCHRPSIFATVEIGIDTLYFMYDFLPMNLEEVSFDDEFGPSPIGPSQRGSRAPQPVPQAAMVHSNLNTLPTDVLTRVQKNKSDEFIV